ncbi:MAG: GNAT family N-acetyltransferase [Ktedonobacterales bacterium]
MTFPDIAIAAVEDNPARIGQSLAVLQAGLGQGFISREQLLTYAAPQTGIPFRGALVAIEPATGSVIGVLTIEIVGAEALQASFLGSYDLVCADVAIRLLRPDSTGLIKSISVSPAYRGRGVASQLIERGLAELAAHGAEHTYSLAWTSKRDGCPLCGVLTAAGFRAVRRIERFWYNDSIANGYICPADDNPCECAVQVMLR